MAALYEGYTLCGRVSGQSLSDSGIQGIEVERDNDHVIVTDSSRSVTLYMVKFYVYSEEIFTCYSRSVELVSQFKISHDLLVILSSTNFFNKIFSWTHRLYTYIYDSDPKSRSVLFALLLNC